MAGLLTASSPVEIQAKAEAAGMEGEAREAALRLFHDLTSRLELAAIETDARGGEEWPRHRYWFGTGIEILNLLDVLRGEPSAVEATSVRAALEHETLFVSGTDGGFAAALAACGSGAALRDITQRIEARLKTAG